METILFHSVFLENIIAIRGRPTEEQFQVLIQMEVAFRSSGIAFFKESFILTSGNRFLINYELCAFIPSFFLMVDTILEVRCKPIFFHFFYS